MLMAGMPSVDSFFVVRTMQALEVLAFRPSSAPQVADVLRVDARTARRLLNRLADEGWLVRTEGRVRTYTLSLRVAALAAHFLERAPITRAATTAVRALHERTGGVAHLTVPSYRSVLCLAQRADGANARPRFRELIPAHASAGGKVLLAHRVPWRESVLELPLERLTERTIVDPDALRSECEVTLARGFALEDGEYRDGVHGVAVAVPDASGDVLAAVALSGPADLDVAGKVEAVAEAAAGLSRSLADDGMRDAA
jgi:DNA-binding IclR family transcriptional regulator